MEVAPASPSSTLDHTRWQLPTSNDYRWYTPGAGRYSRTDPLGLAGGWNLYSYVGGNPLMYTDPLGLQRGDYHIPTPDEIDRMKQESCARQAMVDNFFDMREANTKKSDKYFHCKANCEATRCGPFGHDKACELSEIRELGDQILKGDPPAASAADERANQYGRDRARDRPNVTCKVICARYRPNGLPAKY